VRLPVGRARAALAVMSLLIGCAWVPGFDPEPTSAGTPGMIGRPDEDADATRSYLATLNFSGPPRRSHVTCHGGAVVEMDVYPERYSHQVDPALASSRGRIVAMVKNVGAVKCNDMKLAPGDSAYWWMGANRGYALTTEFYSIPAHGAIHRVAETGPVNWHHDGQRPTPDAKISNVIVHPAGSDDGDDLEPVHFGHNSTWIACLGGCCESATMLESM